MEKFCTYNTSEVNNALSCVLFSDLSILFYAILISHFRAITLTSRREVTKNGVLAHMQELALMNVLILIDGFGHEAVLVIKIKYDLMT